jgi:hypothetical protein
MSLEQQLFLQFLPLAFILPLAFARYIRQRAGNVRDPVKDKLLRPPGESLRVEVQKMEENCNFLFTITFAIPICTLPLLRTTHWAVPTMLVALTCGPLSLLLFRRWNKISNYWLGFQGERAVAEELNQLMRKGCVVFHDLQMPERGNIDHIVVAPSGLFVVETKARRKRRAKEGREEHKIIYDGKVLHTPQGTDTSSLAQVERNAAWLADQLSKALAEPIRVTPILTFPGWFIERSGRSYINVVSHKNIGQVIHSNLGNPLNEKQMKQITAWVEDHCRNVEF